MNKKYLTFVFIGVFMMAFAAAALVPFLSNTISGDITVDSPLYLEADLYNLEGNIINERVFTLTNNADLPVSAVVEVAISGNHFSEDNIGEEFETLLIGLKLPVELCSGEYSEGYCFWDASTDKAYTGVVNGDYYVQMGDRSDPTPIQPGQTLDGKLKLRFAHNVVGYYTISAKAMVPEESKNLA